MLRESAAGVFEFCRIIRVFLVLSPIFVVIPVSVGVILVVLSGPAVAAFVDAAGSLYGLNGWLRG